jgi:hypothetical protein
MATGTLILRKRTAQETPQMLHPASHPAISVLSALFFLAIGPAIVALRVNPAIEDELD